MQNLKMFCICIHNQLLDKVKLLNYRESFLKDNSSNIFVLRFLITSFGYHKELYDGNNFRSIATINVRSKLI